MIPSFEQRRCAGHRLVAQTWGAIGGAAVSVVGGALMNDGGGGGGGGAGSQTQSKEPWAPAQPWIMSNLMQGQNLQNAYTAQPFSAAQNRAYNNQGNQSAYMRALVPDLLGQISGQQVGFDRANQNARPNAFNFASNGTIQGLLAQMASGANNGSPIDNTPKVQQPEPGKFTQQDDIVSGMNMTSFDGKNMYGSGGYGTFKYGMPMPTPGTQQFKDMNEYFANGGFDPNDLYGRKASTAVYANAMNTNPNSLWNPNAGRWFAGVGNPEIGGGGIGDTGANAAASASGNDGW